MSRFRSVRSDEHHERQRAQQVSDGGLDQARVLPSLLLLLSMADCPLSGPSRVSRTLEPIELLNKIFAALPISFNNACCVALGQGGFN